MRRLRKGHYSAEPGHMIFAIAALATNVARAKRLADSHFRDWSPMCEDARNCGDDVDGYVAVLHCNNDPNLSARMMAGGEWAWVRE